MKRIFISMVLFLSMVAAHAQTQTENDEFTKAICRAIELQSLTSNYEQLVTQQLQTLVDNGYVSAEQIPALAKELTDFAIPLVEKKLVSLYRKHFTLEEVKQINAYLSSSVGQKTLKLLPLFTEEGMKIMQTPEAQQKVGELVLRYMQKKE